ncbi:camp-dependent protein kinase catalytic subunit [Gamsiella multidivaricata]|nr:camp-dependent protein kinase catalytic subunit [Gamsiella multidivaricata]
MQSVEMVSAETTLSERQQLEQHQQLEQQKQQLLLQQQQQQQQLQLQHQQQQLFQLQQQQQQQEEQLRQAQAQIQTPTPSATPTQTPAQVPQQAQVHIDQAMSEAQALQTQEQAEQAQRLALLAQQQLQQQRQQAQRGSQQATRRKFNLNDFRIHRTLGTGSFGRVHLVQSRFNSRFYAMKVLKKSEIVRLRQIEHTNNEKMILERVEHPFLINMWGTFQDVRNLYMVMDYVVGGELFSVLRKTQRFPEHVARFYTCEVLLALEYLHSHAVIYRDLKPENLLLDSMGHIKITDFGFAKHVPQNMTWTLCGTPDYLAPEIIQSKGYGKAVDWWSMGVLMFEMCAGFPPFFDEDHIKLYGKIMAGRVRYPPHFSPALKDLLKRLLTADLTKRYGNLRGGATDIKNHVWFEGINWDMVYSRQVEAPYRPTILGEGDSSNFDDYPEDAENYGVYPADEMDELGMYFPGF